MSCVLTDLKAVRELLSVPERWTKDGYAKDATGELATFDSQDATCFCLSGALMRVNASDEAERAIRKLVWRGQIVKFNDAPERTHAQVLALLDKAISAVTA